MADAISTAGLPKLLVILGPTATGKTDISVEVANMLKGEIVSADSALVYRYMDVGTAKPTPSERKNIPHYMIDVVDPDEDYSVVHYQSEAEGHIRDIYNKNKLPLLVGGTGLYIGSVVDRYTFPAAGINTEFRQQCQEEARIYGNQHLHKKLVRVDPVSAKKLHPNDLKRIIRALEVYYFMGCPISSYNNAKENTASKYQVVMIGLNMPRDLLYRRIEDRVDLMMDMGLVSEVKGLLDRGYHPGLTSMQALGYKEISSYLFGEMTLEEAVALLKRNTRRFAKRQITWFKRDSRIKWWELSASSNKHEISQEIAMFAAGVFKGTSNPFSKRKNFPTEGPP